MKKLFALLLTLALLLALTACGSNTETTVAATEAPTQAEAFTGNFEDVFQAIINRAVELEPKEVGTDGQEYDGMMRSLLAEGGYGAANVPVEEDASESVLGMSSEEMTKYVAKSLEQKPNGSWFTHSIVLVQVTEGTDAAAVAAQIKDGTSPSRFGCLKAEAISVCYTGSYILLAASAEASVNAICQAFTELSAAEVTRLDRTNDWNTGEGGLMGGMMG